MICLTSHNKLKLTGLEGLTLTQHDLGSLRTHKNLGENKSNEFANAVNLNGRPLQKWIHHNRYYSPALALNIIFSQLPASNYSLCCQKSQLTHVNSH